MEACREFELLDYRQFWNLSQLLYQQKLDLRAEPESVGRERIVNIVYHRELAAQAYISGTRYVVQLLDNISPSATRRIFLFLKRMGAREIQPV